jgi:hypothetical protein
MTKRTKYDFERLDNYCKENNVTLLQDYSVGEMTKNTIIKGTCIYDNCQETFEKKIVNLIYAGGYCKTCIKIISIKRAKQTFLEKYGSENILQLDFIKEKTNPHKFTFQKLQDYCKEYSIELCEDYSKCHITKKSLITAKCQTNDCLEITSKIFREIEKRGIYCKKCMNDIKIEKTQTYCLQKYGVHNSLACKEVQEKVKQTNIQKYGFEFTFQSEEIKEKIKQSNLQKYGVEFPTQNNEIMNKIKQTNLEKYGCETSLHAESIKVKVYETIKNKYGVENISQNENIKDKKIKTSLKNWGVEYPSQNTIIQEKTKQTNLANLGVEYPSQNENVKEKSKQTCLEKFGVEYSWQNEDVKNKIKETNLNKLGVEYPTQNEEVKNKIKNVINKKYGVDYPSQNEIIKLKTKETNLLKYGVECTLQNDTVKEKTKSTNLSKYGVEYPIQNPEIMEKHVKSSHSRKNYIFPSGRIEIVQGYEPFALNDLIINEKIEESNIIVGVKNVPEIKFNDCDGKIHRYYVDIFIPSQNKCIEVKSLYTYNDNIKTNLLKQEAAIKLGYDFDFWIYDNKGNRVN